MACDAWRGQAGRLPRRRTRARRSHRAVSVHMRTCAACAVDALERVQMKRSVADGGKEITSPALSAEQRSSKQVAARPRRATGWGWKIVVVPALTVRTSSPWPCRLATCSAKAPRRQRVYSELADLHVAALASATPVDVVSTDRHTVKPWFAGKDPVQFQPSRFAGHGVYAARWARHLYGANTGGTADLPAAQARDFSLHFSGSRTRNGGAVFRTDARGVVQCRELDAERIALLRGWRRQPGRYSGAEQTVKRCGLEIVEKDRTVRARTADHGFSTTSHLLLPAIQASNSERVRSPSRFSEARCSSSGPAFRLAPETARLMQGDTRRDRGHQKSWCRCAAAPA